MNNIYLLSDQMAYMRIARHFILIPTHRINCVRQRVISKLKCPGKEHYPAAYKRTEKKQNPKNISIFTFSFLLYHLILTPPPQKLFATVKV